MKIDSNVVEKFENENTGVIPDDLEIIHASSKKYDNDFTDDTDIMYKVILIDDNGEIFTYIKFENEYNETLNSKWFRKGYNYV